MFNKDLIKIICVFSGILGAIIGLIALIPAFTPTAFGLEMFLVAPFIIIYLKKLKLLESVEMDKCLLVGAVSGFVSSFGMALTFMPISLLLNLIFKIQLFLWVKVLLFNIAFIIPMIILIALLSALLNMFSGFLTVYFYEYIKKIR